MPLQHPGKLMKEEIINIKEISKNKFNAFVMCMRNHIAPALFQELEYYSNDSDTVLGFIALDLTDRDYCCMILRRDDEGKFRYVENETDYVEISTARDWLFMRMRWHTNNVPQKLIHYNIKGWELFNIIVSAEKLHPFFITLKNEQHYHAARQIMVEIFRYFEDVDGNFIEQFQSFNGFDSRLFELYLFAFLTEEGFGIKRENDRPDFIIEKYGTELAVEAVIVDRKKDNPPQYFPNFKEITPDKIKKENSNDMPLRFGSPLYSKLQKKYWELPHVKGKPFILAIADFHDDQSMTWSYNAIIDYLYGYKFNAIYDNKGELIIIPEKISAYKKANGVEIEAGFFFQPDVKNISGVLFSSVATLSKFTRMGIQAGFGVENQTVIRSGVRYKDDPNASEPEAFKYEVTEESNETWTEGMNLFHNPNALIKIDMDLFPTICHHELIDGVIRSTIPEFHPYFSFTYNIIKK